MQSLREVKLKQSATVNPLGSELCNVSKSHTDDDWLARREETNTTTPILLAYPHQHSQAGFSTHLFFHPDQFFH